MTHQSRLPLRLDLFMVLVVVGGLGYLFLAAAMNDASPFVLVRGTSMQPTYHEGDLLVSQRVAPADIAIGDVIAFTLPRDARRQGLPEAAAHRVIGISARDGALQFETRGDNSDPDPFTVPSRNVNGVVVKNLGLIGRPLLLLGNTRMLLMLGLPLLTFAAVYFVMNSSGESEGQPETRPQPPGGKPLQVVPQSSAALQDDAPGHETYDHSAVSIQQSARETAAERLHENVLSKLDAAPATPPGLAAAFRDLGHRLESS